jgi:CubicO group peptidase (beta-lactamase class C family)
MQIDPQFKPVADHFFQLTSEQPYGGAALCIYKDGRPVLDIWAGDARPGTPWERDTKSIVFSSTKGIVTMLVLRAVERGEIDINERVSKYWPEFGCNGKEDITVKMILRHRAGLNTTERNISYEEMLAVTTVEEAFAEQATIYPPDSGFVYHALSIGHLLGKILFNVTGKRVNQLLQEEIANPLGAPMWIGIPKDFHYPLALLDSDLPDVLPTYEFGTKEYWTDRAMSYGGGLNPNFVSTDKGWNDPRVLQSEIAGAGGVTDARTLAKIYSAAVTETDGLRLLKDSTIMEAISHPNPGDNIFGEPQPHPIHSLGFIIANDLQFKSISNTTFGHNGLGGQQGCGDLSSKVGFGYVTNWVPVVADGMLRHRQLTSTLIDCL